MLQNLKLIDSHCHLDFDALAGDLSGVMARMEAAGVSNCVTISTRVEQFEKICAIADDHNNIWCSVGTHPHNAHEELHISSDDLIKLSDHQKCIAIGEAGLDYFYDNSPRDAQRQGFLNHIAAARQTGLPLIIHARDADDDMAQILKDETKKGKFPFVLHCFSSSIALANTGIELGGYVSFSGILTFKNAKTVQEVAKNAPKDKILVETDAPFLAPSPLRGKSNEPAFVRHTAQFLADIRGVELATIAEQTTSNFYKLFSKANSE